MPEFDVRLSLDTPAARPLRSDVDPVISVSINAGSNKIWIRRIQADTPEDATGEARKIANRVLDGAALKLGQAHEVLPIPVRIESEGKPLVMSGSEACVEVEATPSRPALVVPVALDAATFFRRALVAERQHSLFEAFREYFRALEWLTTEMKGCWSEEALACVIEQALGEKELGPEVEKLAQHLVAGFSSGLPLAERALRLARDLYKIRNDLDHAKHLPSCTYTIPYNTKAEEDVRRSVPLARATARAAIEWFLRWKNS